MGYGDSIRTTIADYAGIRDDVRASCRKTGVDYMLCWFVRFGGSIVIGVHGIRSNGG